jgi:hypothetical protein
MKANFQMLASLVNKCLQIEIEQMFGLIGVLTTLRRCKLKENNLGRIITMVKNLPNDLHFNFSQRKDLTNFMKVESLLAKDNYDLIKESNYFEQTELDNE